MDFKQYKEVLAAFNDTGLIDLDMVNLQADDLNHLMTQQDTLIQALQAKGARIAGWKIVDKYKDITVSPIFDFQCLEAHGASVPHQALRGTEMELCYQLTVPTSEGQVSDAIASLKCYGAVELIRPEINANNNPACDLYFNYGVLITEQAVTGSLLFSGGEDYQFAFSVEQAASKKAVLFEQGVRECIRRGYGGEDFFFITGTLNGLVPAKDSVGPNTLKNDHNTLLDFTLV